MFIGKQIKDKSNGEGKTWISPDRDYNQDSPDMRGLMAVKMRRRAPMVCQRNSVISSIAMDACGGDLIEESMRD